MKNLFTHIGYYGDQALIALEISQDDHEIRMLRTLNQKGRIVVQEQKRFAKQADLEAYLRLWGTLPILLSLKGENTVENWIENEETDIIAATLGVAVETAKDFTYERLANTGTHSLINVIRTEQIAAALTQLGEQQKRVISIHLSSASLALLVPAMPDYKSEISYQIRTESEHYTWSDGFCQSAHCERGIVIEELAQAIELPHIYTQIYADILAYYWPGMHQSAGSELLHNNRHKTQQLAKASKVLGVLGLGMLILFGCLLLGQLFFKNQLAALQNDYLLHKAVLEKLDEQQNQLAQQQAFWQSQSKNTLKSSRIAWYIDQIASLAPAALSFQELLYRPTAKQLKKLDPD